MNDAPASDLATLAYYQDQAPRYTLSFGQGPSRHLDAFLDRLPAGASILELGCGGGRDAARMAERGFAIDATDGTAAMAAKARERTGLPARQMRFDELDADNEYDAVWAHACLLHVPRSHVGAILRSIHDGLKSGGLHYASFKLGDAEGRDLLGRLHNFPDPDWIEREYRHAGWEIVDVEQFPGKGADGTMRNWIALTVRKPLRA